MNALVYRVTPWTAWLAVFLSTLALLFAAEGATLRVYDWARPPVVMTWRAEALSDGRYGVRFSGVKYRADCDLTDMRAWGLTPDGEARLDIKRDSAVINRRMPTGPFGPSPIWALIPPPIGDPQIVAEFVCSGREVKLRVDKG